MDPKKRKAPAAGKGSAVARAPAAGKAPRAEVAPEARKVPAARKVPGRSAAPGGRKAEGAKTVPAARRSAVEPKAPAARAAPPPRKTAAGKAAPAARKAPVPGKAGAAGPAPAAKGLAAGTAATARKAPGAKAAPAARKAPAAGRAGTRRRGPPPESIDPEGYFIARVRGEEAVRQAPHPMTEDDLDAAMRLHALGEAPVSPDDEELGELPWRYGDDAFVALPRDPRTLFLYWDHAEETRARAFEWLDQPRAQLWLFAETEGGWERVRVVEFALEARGFYVHDLEPGRTYRAEIHVVDRQGRERRLAEPSNPVALPPSGPSALVDDLFARIPWDVPLERWIRELRAGGAFPAELRDLLARLSDWSRFRAPGGAEDRPTSQDRGRDVAGGSGLGKGAGSGGGKGAGSGGGKGGA
jgi:hypothetical protein